MLPASKPLIPCRGCGALVADLKGSAHAFINASTGCWSVYGEVLLMQYGRSPAAPLHRLTADAYALQHPGVRSAQSIQSTAVHLIGLHLLLTRPYDFLATVNLLERALKAQDQFTWLEPPHCTYQLTILDVRAAIGSPNHDDVVRSWADEVWQAWGAHHASITRWVASLEQA